MPPRWPMVVCANPVVGRLDTPTWTQTDPELAAALDALVDPDSRGYPMSPLRWTCKSTGQPALALTRGGHPVAPKRPARLPRNARPVCLETPGPFAPKRPARLPRNARPVCPETPGPFAPKSALDHH